jgi:hypothetical protein
MVIDGQYDGPGMSLGMLFHMRTLHQRKRQRDRFTTLDRVEVFHCMTTEAAPTMRDQHGNEMECGMAHRSPYLVKTNVRFSVRNWPKEMYRGRSE